MRSLPSVVAALVLGASCGRGGFGRIADEDGGRDQVDARRGPDAALVDAAPDAVPPPDAAPPHNLVFVTSTIQDACSMGLAAADAVCSTRAAAAGLPGTYRAWMSAPGLDARDRLGAVRGWVRPDGRPFADTVADLVAGKVLFPPRLDELGAEVGFAFTQSATEANGTYSNAHGCAVGGLPGNGGTRWGSGIVTGAARLHCFGVDLDEPVVIEPAPGRIAFTTAGSFTPASGIPSADALCASEASAQGLTGSYRAFLPTTTATAASRFDLTGPRWVRLDGIPVVDVTVDISTWKLIAAVERSAADAVAQRIVWTGSSATAPSLASTCTDWSSTSGMGRTTFSTESLGLGGGFELACTQPAAVFCLQQ